MPDSLPARSVNRRTALKAFSYVAGGFLLVNAHRLQASHDTPDQTLRSIFPDFTDQSIRRLREVLTPPAFTGRIPPEVVRDLLTFEKKAIGALMVSLVPLAQTFSHPPISHYQVGVVARGASGSLYLGFNIEIPGQALGFAVHGEQAALSSAYMHGESGVAALAVSAAPCGHCRQFMNELSPDGSIEILIPQSEPTRLSALLPMAFGPRDLGRSQGAFPIRPASLAAVGPLRDPLHQAAFDAARTSYAPYSEAYSGVAISTRSGRIYRGSYIENAAFNPSLSPLQTALVQLILAGDEPPAMARAALAESNTAKISQKSATEAVLTAIAPSVHVETVPVNRNC